MLESTRHRFDIALSFPGRHRRLARYVATALGQALGDGRVFFDEWYRDELVGTGLDEKLQQIYRHDAHIVVPFFSQHYKKSNWCELEWNAIRAVLVERRAEDAVIPVVIDDTEIEGWTPVDIGIPYGAKGSKNGRQTAQRLLAARLTRLGDGGTETSVEHDGNGAATEAETSQNSDSGTEDSSSDGPRPTVERRDEEIYRIVFFEPAEAGSGSWLQQSWRLLQEFPTQQRFRDRCELLDAVETWDQLRDVTDGVRPERTIVLVGFDCYALQGEGHERLLKQLLYGIRHDSSAPPWVAGVIAAGTRPDDAFKVRDSGAHGAVPMSRLNDADWLWQYLDDMVHGIRPKVPGGFGRDAQDGKSSRQLVVTGGDPDAREIYRSVHPVALRLTGQSPLLACPASCDDVVREWREVKERAHAVILRVRNSDESGTGHSSGTDRMEIGNAIGLFLAGAAGPSGLNTYCVANEREAPTEPPPEWRDFAYYAYKCEVDLALRLYEWLLVADDGTTIQ